MVSVQVPIYAAIVAASGASGRGLLLGTLGPTAIMLICGRPCCLFLNGIRTLFGAPERGLNTRED